MRSSLLLLAAVLAAACGETPEPAAPAVNVHGMPVGPLLTVGGDGYFRPDVADAWQGREVYAGRNVVMSWPPPGGLLGRLEDPEAETTFYLRDDRGRLVEHVLPTTLIDGSILPSVRKQMALQLGLLLRDDGTLPPVADLHGPLSRALASAPAAVREPGEPAVRAPETGTSPPPVGAALAAWVPDDLAFVRFRTVAAAYRMVQETDALAAALLASAGDGRDHGTVRLTIHDLLLPTIWHTNPGSEDGVAEVGLVIAPPVRAGRLRVALLLRIDDPELHHMQTVAGIAQEAYEDHLWRPANDPFPRERPRRNFRRKIGDVEIVATDAGLLELLAAGTSRPLAADRGFLAARAQAGERVRSEAFFAYASGVARTDLLDAVAWQAMRDRAATRAMAGLDWLVRAWSGLEVPPAASVEAAPVRDPAPLEGTRWVRAVTDGKGAAVTVAFDTAAAATAAAQVLGTTDDGAADRACLRSLQGLGPLALVEAPATDLAERAFVVLGWRPACPAGGTYTSNPVTRAVRCSAHGRLDSFESAAAPRGRVSAVSSNGAVLSFRLAIDWSRRQ